MSQYDGFADIAVGKDADFSIGANCIFNSKTHLNRLGVNHKCMLSVGNSATLSIGSNCAFSGVSIGANKSIIIKDNVMCGPNVVIFDNDGHLDDHRASVQPIVIEDHVWVGINSMIMKGVRVGRFSMIGAGSVVRTSTPPYSIVIGNPAKIVGFSKTPNEIIEFEKMNYDEEDRLSSELLMTNYKKYFTSRYKSIREYTKL